MKGRQLRALKVRKKEDVLPEVFLKGTAEEIVQLSPEVKQKERQKYLRNVSKIRKTGMINVSTSQSDSDTHVNEELYRTHLTVADSVREKTVEKREKEFKLDLNSKFSLYLHDIRGKKLENLSKDLFPKELCENIAFVPEAFQSSLREPISLEQSFCQKKTGVKMFNTVKNVTRSDFFRESINFDAFGRSKFFGFTSGLKARKSYFSGNRTMYRSVEWESTDRTSKSTRRGVEIKDPKT